MTISRKAAICLLITVLSLAVFAVLAFTGLFNLVETHFYNPSVMRDLNAELKKNTAIINDYTNELTARFKQALNEDAVRRSFLLDQNADDIYERNRIFRLFMLQISGLQWVRFVDSAGIRMHYSTNASDEAERNSEKIAYKIYTDAEDAIPFDDTLLSGINITRIVFDEQKQRIVFFFPFYDSMDIYRGAAIFSLSNHSFSDKLLDAQGININDTLYLVSNPKGMIMGTSEKEHRMVSPSIASSWRENGTATEVIDSPAGTSFVLLTQETEQSIFVGVLIPQEVFAIPAVLKGILLFSFALTAFILLFLIFNVKQDPVVLVQNHLRELQVNLMKEYYQLKADMDWQLWRRELELRREDVRSELKHGVLIKEGSPVDNYINSFFDKSWDDLLSVIGSRAQNHFDTEKLEEVIRRLINPNAVSMKDTASSQKSMDETADELEKLNDIDNLDNEPEELEELEELEDVDKANNDIQPDFTQEQKTGLLAVAMSLEEDDADKKDSEVAPVDEPETAPEPIDEPEAALEPIAEPETEAVALETEAALEIQNEPETEAEAAPVDEPETAPEPIAEPETEVAAPETEAALEPIDESETKAAAPEAEVQDEPETEAVLEPIDEPEIEADQEPAELEPAEEEPKEKRRIIIEYIPHFFPEEAERDLDFEPVVSAWIPNDISGVVGDDALTEDELLNLSEPADDEKAWQNLADNAAADINLEILQDLPQDESETTLINDETLSEIPSEPLKTAYSAPYLEKPEAIRPDEIDFSNVLYEGPAEEEIFNDFMAFNQNDLLEDAETQAATLNQDFDSEYNNDVEEFEEVSEEDLKNEVKVTVIGNSSPAFTFESPYKGTDLNEFAKKIEFAPARETDETEEDFELDLDISVPANTMFIKTNTPDEKPDTSNENIPTIEPEEIQHPPVENIPELIPLAEPSNESEKKAEPSNENEKKNDPVKPKFVASNSSQYSGILYRPFWTQNTGELEYLSGVDEDDDEAVIEERGGVSYISGSVLTKTDKNSQNGVEIDEEMKTLVDSVLNTP